MRLARELPAEGRQALEQFLEGASAQGETIVSATRLALCTLALIRLWVLVPHLLVAGDAKYWISSGGMLLGALISLPWLLKRERRRVSSARLHGSVVLDCVVLTVVLGPMVVWPHDGYTGFIHEPEAAAYLLVVVAGAARLSPSAATLGCAVNACALGGLLALDAAFWPDRITYVAGDLAIAGILYLAAAIFSCGGAQGTRLLVYRGAHSFALAARATQRLGIYVSEDVAREAVESDDALALGGTRQDVAVLFSDLRGFTSYSETLDPEQLVTELNAYFEAMLAALRAEGGQIDKFVGDAIMTVFSGDDAGCASIRAALGMQEALERHNDARAAQDLPPMKQGVGVHYGSVVSGNIGTQERMQHTVIGDTVNVASRLESATKERGVPVIVSAACVDRARAEGGPLPELTSNGRLSVRGRVEDMEIYSVGGEERT